MNRPSTFDAKYFSPNQGRTPVFLYTFLLTCLGISLLPQIRYLPDAASLPNRQRKPPDSLV